MLGFVDRVVGVTDVAVDRLNRMTCHTSDSSVGGRVTNVVVVRIVKLAREKWHGVVTTGTPPRRLKCPRSFGRNFARFANRRTVGRIVKAA